MSDDWDCGDPNCPHPADEPWRHPTTGTHLHARGARIVIEPPNDGQDTHRNGNGPFDVDVWWTPDCGYLHLERNPRTIPFHCPDDVPAPTSTRDTGD